MTSRSFETPAVAMLDYWKSRTLLLSEGFRTRLRELAASDYPDNTPLDVIEFLVALTEELDRKVLSATAERELVVLAKAIQDFAPTLDWLDNAHSGQTPPCLVDMLLDIAKKLEPGTLVVARPHTSYTYSIRDARALFTKYVDFYVDASKQQALKDRLRFPIKLISFPRIERDDVLSHTIFGHELGHPIIEKWLALDTMSATYHQAQQVAKAKVEEYIKQQYPTYDDHQRVVATAELLDDVMEVRSRALEEIVSDAVAVFLFGPSAFLGLYESLWGPSWDAVPSRQEDWYPPSRMRIRRMLRLMDELNLVEPWLDQRVGAYAEYADAVRSFMESAQALAADTSDIAAINNDPLLKAGYEWMESCATDAVSFAKSEVGHVCFVAEDVFGALPELLRRLELGLPPNEVGSPDNPTPVDFRAALLAGWMFRIRNPVKDRSPEASEDTKRFHMRVVRGVEYALLQKQYAAAESK